MPNPVGPTSMLPFFSTEIYSFIHKKKSSQSSQMEVSAFPFCFPTCSLPQSTCYNSAHYSKLFVHTNIFIFPKYFGLTNYRTKTYGACGLGNNSEQFCWRRWGSLLPGLRTLDPPTSPPSTPEEICVTHVYKVAFKNLPQPLISHIPSLEP